ncbi:uncharacterized protein METZ01_LOCUS501612, partial [marine metagenome]
MCSNLARRRWRTTLCCIHHVAIRDTSPEGVEVSLATFVGIGILGPINIVEGRTHDH